MFPLKRLIFAWSLPILMLSPTSFSAESGVFKNPSVFDFFERDFMVSQKWPRQGPWFEGWYVRVVDPDNKRSFAFIVTSYAGPESKIINRDKSGLYAYQTLMIDSPKEISRPLVMERFLKDSQLGPFWQSHESKSFIDRNSAFLQFDSAKSEVHENGLSAKLKMDWSDDKIWNEKLPGWGPGGLVTYQDWFPLQWFVQSLGSKTDYEIELTDSEGNYGEPGGRFILRGSGYAHVEKNWGKEFPDSYMWLQGTSKDNSAHIAIAGGELKVNSFKMDTYLIGYRSEKYQADFNLGQDPTTRFSTLADACQGEFRLQANNFMYELQVVAKAEPETFFWLSTPSKQEYLRKHTIQSFQTEIHTKLYRFGRLVETQTFTESALEFGGKLRLSPAGKPCRYPL